MINKNELRFGNIVQEIIPISGSLAEKQRVNKTMYKINTHTFNREDFEKWFAPIPLTEEILLKCGFKDSGNDELLIYNELDYENQLALHFTKEGLSFVFEQYVESNIKYNYLHQLQNLYFALTGKELEINL